jgi:hypothetical protein
MPRDGSRHELTLQIMERKERIWGQGDRPYNPQRAATNIVEGVPKGNPPSMDLLRWAANATNAELISAVHSRNPDYAFLFYK